MCIYKQVFTLTTFQVLYAPELCLQIRSVRLWIINHFLVAFLEFKTKTRSCSVTACYSFLNKITTFLSRNKMTVILTINCKITVILSGLAGARTYQIRAPAGTLWTMYWAYDIEKSPPPLRHSPPLPCLQCCGSLCLSCGASGRT